MKKFFEAIVLPMSVKQYLQVISIIILQIEDDNNINTKIFNKVFDKNRQKRLAFASPPMVRMKGLEPPRR